MNDETSTTKPLVTSVEDQHGEWCVDFVMHADGTVTYREYRRDAEDAGRWSLINDFDTPKHATLAAAKLHASAQIEWLRAVFPA